MVKRKWSHLNDFWECKTQWPCENVVYTVYTLGKKKRITIHRNVLISFCCISFFCQCSINLKSSTTTATPCQLLGNMFPVHLSDLFNILLFHIFCLFTNFMLCTICNLLWACYSGSISYLSSSTEWAPRCSKIMGNPIKQLKLES